MQPVGDIDETADKGSDRPGWIGLHHLAGSVLGLRGVDIGTETLEAAAEATYPLVEGKLPNLLNIIGVYGSVFAAMMNGDYYDNEYEDDEEDQTTITEANDVGVPTVSGEPGRSDGPEEEDDQHRRESTGVGNNRRRGRKSRRNGELDGALDGFTE